MENLTLKEMFMKKDSRGFSLIELLIVVAIILIIAAIAIPNLLRSRIAANQASAVGSIRTIIRPTLRTRRLTTRATAQHWRRWGLLRGAAIPRRRTPI